MDIYMCTSFKKFKRIYTHLILETDMSDYSKMCHIYDICKRGELCGGVYNSNFNVIIINLETHASMREHMLNEYDFLRLIMITITHETLHWVFWNEIGINDRPDDDIEDIVCEISRY